MFSKKSSVEKLIKDKYPNGLVNGIRELFIHGDKTELTVGNIKHVLGWGTAIHPFVKKPYITSNGGASLSKSKNKDNFFNVKNVNDFLKVAYGVNVSYTAYKKYEETKEVSKLKDMNDELINITNSSPLLRLITTVFSIQKLKSSLNVSDVNEVTKLLLNDKEFYTGITKSVKHIKEKWDIIKTQTDQKNKDITVSFTDNDFWFDFSKLVLSSMLPEDINETSNGSDYNNNEVKQEMEEEEEEEQHKPNYLDNSERPEVKEEPEPEQVEAPGEKQEEEEDDKKSTSTFRLSKDNKSDKLGEVKPVVTIDLSDKQAATSAPKKQLTQEEIDAGVIGDDNEETEAERQQKLIDANNLQQQALMEETRKKEQEKLLFDQKQKQIVSDVKKLFNENDVATWKQRKGKKTVYNDECTPIINFMLNGLKVFDKLSAENAFDPNNYSNDTISRIINEYVKQYNNIFSDKGIYTKIINDDPRLLFGSVANWRKYVAKDDYFYTDESGGGTDDKYKIKFGDFVYSIDKVIDYLNSIAERRSLPIIGKQPIQTVFSEVFKAMDMIEKNKNNPNILYNTNETTLITKSYWDKQNDKIIDDLVRSGTIIKMQRGTDGEEAYDYNGTKFTRDEILTTVKKAKISNLTQSRAVFNNLQLSQMRAGDRRRNRFERRKEKYISINKGAVTKVQKLFEEEKVKVGGMTLNPLLFRKSMC